LNSVPVKSLDEKVIIIVLKDILEKVLEVVPFALSTSGCHRKEGGQEKEQKEAKKVLRVRLLI
jgi:hypothetical protein